MIALKFTQATSIILIPISSSIPLAGREERRPRSRNHSERSLGEARQGMASPKQNVLIWLSHWIWMLNLQKSSGVEAPSNKSSFFSPPGLQEFLGDADALLNSISRYLFSRTDKPISR